MITHGLFIPEEYPDITREHLSDKTERRITGLYQTSHTHTPHTVLPVAHLTSGISQRLDTLIVAQDARFEELHGASDLRTFEPLEDIKAQRPDLKIIVSYAGMLPVQAQAIRTTLSYEAALLNPAVDMVYADMPLNVIFNKNADKHRKTSRSSYEKNELALLTQALVEKRFQERMISPHLINPSDTVVTLGDLTIDREQRTVTIDGEKTPIQGNAAAILGTLAAYQGSWVSTRLMMSNIYTPLQLESGRDPKTVHVYMNKLKKLFAQMGTGAVHNIHGIGDFVRPGDFKKSGLTL